jgi:hypothetical protein
MSESAGFLQHFGFFPDLNILVRCIIVENGLGEQLARFLGTTQYVSIVSSRFEYFLLMFALQSVLNSKFNSASNGDSF